MAVKRRLRDPIGAHRRYERAARRVGPGARCASCGEARPEALIPRSDPMICAECKRRAGGKSDQDDHHPAGWANDPTTIRTPANDHRAELSAAQEDWPKATRENPDGDPLLAGAARIRGAVDYIVYLLERMFLWTAELLETLSQLLVETLGPHWWRNTPLATFAPKR